MAEVLFTIPLRDNNGKLVDVDFTSDNIEIAKQFSPMRFEGLYIASPAANFSMNDVYNVYINGQKSCYLWTTVLYPDNPNARFTVFSTSNVPTTDDSTQYLYGDVSFMFDSETAEAGDFVYLEVARYLDNVIYPLITGETEEEIIQSVIDFFKANKLSFKLMSEDDETPSCLDGEGLYIKPTRTTPPKEYWGLSTDEKPATAENLSIYHEVDTGDTYYFYDGSWTKVKEATEKELFTIRLVPIDGGVNFDEIPVTTSMYTILGTEGVFEIKGYLPDTSYMMCLNYGEEVYDCADYSNGRYNIDNQVQILPGGALSTLVATNFKDQPDPIENKEEYFDYLISLNMRITEGMR